MRASESKSGPEQGWRTDGGLEASSDEEKVAIGEQVDWVGHRGLEDVLAGVLLVFFVSVTRVLVLLVANGPFPLHDAVDLLELTDEELLQVRLVARVDGTKAAGEEGVEEAKRLGLELVAEPDPAEDDNGSFGLAGVDVERWRCKV